MLSDTDKPRKVTAQCGGPSVRFIGKTALIALLMLLVVFSMLMKALKNEKQRHASLSALDYPDACGTIAWEWSVITSGFNSGLMQAGSQQCCNQLKLLRR